MKSIQKYKAKILQGHERQIKDIKFSPDGKYIFSASADRSVIKWDYQNNTKCFVYNHQASVNIICLSKLNNFMICGDSTGCIYIWNTVTDNLQNRISFNIKLNIRSITLSSDEEKIIITFAQRAKNSTSFLEIFLTKDILNPKIEENLETKENEKKSFANQIPESVCKIECSNLNTKFVQSCFVNNNKNILVSREDGYLEMYNFPQGFLITSEKFHNDEILCFDFNHDYNMIATSSRDGEMSLINLDSFKLIHKFKPENPVRNLNTCKLLVIENPYYNENSNVKKISVDSLFDLNTDINDVNFFEPSPKEKENIEKFGNKKEIILAITAGGQDSKFVTTTDQKEGGFDILVYNAINGKRLANFLDHFGPVNILDAFKTTVASGAEDATVRINSLEHYLFKK